MRTTIVLLLSVTTAKSALAYMNWRHLLSALIRLSLGSEEPFGILTVSCSISTSSSGRAYIISSPPCREHSKWVKHWRVETPVSFNGMLLKMTTVSLFSHREEVSRLICRCWISQNVLFCCQQQHIKPSSIRYNSMDCYYQAKYTWHFIQLVSIRTDPLTMQTEAGPTADPLGSLGAYVVPQMYWKIMILPSHLRRKDREQSSSVFLTNSSSNLWMLCSVSSLYMATPQHWIQRYQVSSKI
jgi:hypothetical protein